MKATCTILLFCLAGLCGAASAQTHSLSVGWNLVGNDKGANVDPVDVFGNATAPTSISTSVATVWAWDVPTSRWYFFAPSMTPADLTAYANTKGYGVLTKILKGEGFWVNALSALTLNLTPPSALTPTFPIMFGGIEMQSMGLSGTGTRCDVALTFKNTGAAARSTYLIFDAVVSGTTVAQLSFSVTKLAPGATAQDSFSIYNGQCGTFSLQFNSAASDVY